MQFHNYYFSINSIAEVNIYFWLMKEEHIVLGTLS